MAVYILFQLAQTLFNTQLQTSGAASECSLAHKRCLSGGDTAPSTPGFMLQTTSFWRERFLSRQLEPNLNKMGTYVQHNYSRASPLFVLLL